MKPQASHFGLKTLGEAKLGKKKKKTKSPIQKKSYAYAGKIGKENVGVSTSKVQKRNAMAEITRMEVKEENAGPKRKSRVPPEEIMENAEVGKRPKLEVEVATFGKLLAT